MERKIKVLMAKVGVDAHDRGIRVLCTTLRNAGMEVIYTGLYQTPEMVVRAAIQEDVDVIGVSILSGAHLHHIPQVLDEMRKNGLKDVLFVLGGVIPQADLPALKQMGVEGIFRPGSAVEEIIDYIRENVKKE